MSGGASFDADSSLTRVNRRRSAALLQGPAIAGHIV